VLAAHIPLILAREPGSVLVLGLRTGITLGSAETYDLARLVCVDPNPAATAAARLFAPYNHQALRDGRLDVVSCDPANYLALAPARYDVVISVLAMPGTELARLARAKLSPGGIFCQAVEIDRLGEAGLKSLARQIAYYFPHVDLWWTGRDRLLLAASMEPLELTSSDLVARLTVRGIKDDLKRIGAFDDTGMLSLYMMDREALVSWAGSTPADSRARNFLAYRAPRHRQGRGIAEALAALEYAHTGPEALIADLEAGSAESAVLIDRLERCLEARSRYVRFLSAAGAGRLRDAAGYIEGAAANAPENGLFAFELSNFCIFYSRALMQGGRFSDALNAARRAIEANSGSYRAPYNLATLEAGRSPSEARGLLRRAIGTNPDYLPAYLLLAEVEIDAGQIDAASEALAQVLSIEPLNIRAHHLRALCFMRRDLLEDARADLEFVIGFDHDNTAALSALAYAWLLEGDLNRAQKYYRRALRTDPQNLEVLNNLATVLAEKLQYRKAIEVWEKALKLDPGNQDILDNLKEARQSAGER
jgi:tetratricopeptide (TPR) repeat protein/SAM-dependent methyltransferase